MNGGYSTSPSTSALAGKQEVERVSSSGVRTRFQPHSYNLLICHLLNKYVIKINREFFYLQMKWAFRLPSSSALAGKQVERVQVSGFEPVTGQWSGPFPVKPEVDQAGTFNRSPIQLGPQMRKFQFTVNFGAKPSRFYSVRQRKIQKN